MKIEKRECEMYGWNLGVKTLAEYGHVAVLSDRSGDIWLSPDEADQMADHLRTAAAEVREAQANSDLI